MSGLELNKIKESIARILKNKLKDNLFAIISTGSFSSGDFKQSWSDIDVLIVVERLDLQTKKNIAQTINILEKKHKRHFGVNTITKKEFRNPILPAISMEGKTLQALLDLKYSSDRLIFCKNKQLKYFYLPNNKKIRDYSISNLAMFLLRNRRTLTRQIPKTFNEYKKTIEKEVRASFIMTKLAIQYFTLYNCQNNKEMIKKAEELFKGFNFNILKLNLKVINKWPRIKKYKQLDKILKSTDIFIENFSHYVFKKASKY